MNSDHDHLSSRDERRAGTQSDRNPSNVVELVGTLMRPVQSWADRTALQRRAGRGPERAAPRLFQRVELVLNRRVERRLELWAFTGDYREGQSPPMVRQPSTSMKFCAPVGLPP